MNKNDFKLFKTDLENGHENYWFEVNGDTREFLTNKYIEQSMKAVFRVVYSKDENLVGVERTFPFNYDVVLSDDEGLKNVLIELVSELKENKNELDG